MKQVWQYGVYYPRSGAFCWFNGTYEAVCAWVKQVNARGGNAVILPYFFGFESERGTL